MQSPYISPVNNFTPEIRPVSSNTRNFQPNYYQEIQDSKEYNKSSHNRTKSSQETYNHRKHNFEIPDKSPILNLIELEGVPSTKSFQMESSLRSQNEQTEI